MTAVLEAPEMASVPPAFEKNTDFRPHLTMDTSALIQLSNGPARGKKYIDILHYLKQERNVQVSFTDQVVFEFTGLLPQTQQQFLKESENLKDRPLAASFSHGRQSGLEDIIKACTANSPRICTRHGLIPGRYERNRSFLSLFLSDAPDATPASALISTSIGRQFNDRTVAELEMAAGSTRHTEQYNLSFEDALKLAPGYFDYRKLQLTWKAAHNLGWFSTEELKKQLNHGRHITVDKTQGYLKLEHDHPLLKVGQNRPKGSAADPYLQLGDLIDHGELSPQAIEGVGRVWKLTLGDMFHSGLLPRQELMIVASATGFPVPASEKLTLAAAREKGLLADDWRDRLKDYCQSHPSERPVDHAEAIRLRFEGEGVRADRLAIMGVLAPQKTWNYFKDALAGSDFFEHHVTLQDAQRIASIDAHSIPLRFPAIGILSSASALARAHQTEFITRCRDLLPYEKVFSEALINGAITAEEFLRIGQRSGALFSEDEKYTTADKSIDIRFNPFQPERSRITIAPEGIQTRVFGKEAAVETLVLADLKNRHPLKSQSPLKMPALGDLLAAAKSSIYERRDADNVKYHRIFDAVLTPAVMKDAFHVREMARDVLGDVRLHQIEYDFANKHFRVLVKQMGRKPYETPYTSLYANSRADQWDLGELSVLESVLSSKHRNNIVLNTDHELSGTLESRVVDNELIRKKPDYRISIEQSVRKLRSHPESSRLTNLNVEQFLSKLDQVIKRMPPQRWEELGDKYSFVSFLRQYPGNEKSLSVLSSEEQEAFFSGTRRKWKPGTTVERVPMPSGRERV